MWPREYLCCKDCGKNELKHYGKGYCRRCYKRYKYKLNPTPFKLSERNRYLNKTEAIKKRANEYYHSHKIEIAKTLKEHREAKWFSSRREEVLARDNNTCLKCGNTGNIVHHIDGNGRGSTTPNNALSNLMTLCRSCHCVLHKPRLGTGKG